MQASYLLRPNRDLEQGPKTEKKDNVGFEPVLIVPLLLIIISSSVLNHSIAIGCAKIYQNSEQKKNVTPLVKEIIVP